MSQNCSDLYSPEPDVAGQAVFISFLAHTSVFLVLALVVTPIVQLYIPIVRPEHEWGAAGEVEVVSISDIPTRPEPMGQPIVPEASSASQRLKYRCYCREAIQDTYTSQYITGVAFVVTAFVKINTVSYYHLRVIYCLLAMNSIIGVASNFDRDSRLRFWIRLNHRPKSWKMIDFVYVVNLVVFFAFSIFIFVKQDQNFSRCYKHSRGMILATWFWFAFLCTSTFLNGNIKFRGAGIWLFIFLAMAGFVGFQSWQIWVLTRTFRKKEVAEGDTDENAFTFGQILVLFMVVPLIGDFTAALMVDLKRIEGQTWKDRRTALLNIFRVLVPYFANNVIKDMRRAVRKLTTSTFIWSLIDALKAFIKFLLARTQNLFTRIHNNLPIPFRPKSTNKPPRTPRLYKSNTIRLESQEDIINASPLASPPRSLQLPRRGSLDSGSDDSRSWGQGWGPGGRGRGEGHDEGQRQGQSQNGDQSRDPDAILPAAASVPVPGSVRQRPSFPHELSG